MKKACVLLLLLLLQCNAAPSRGSSRDATPASSKRKSKVSRALDSSEDLPPVRSRTSQKQSSSGKQRRAAASEESSDELWDDPPPPRGKHTLVTYGKSGRKRTTTSKVTAGLLASKLRSGLAAAGEKMLTAQSAATGASRKLQRSVKMMTSGTWESALLRATWPDEALPDQRLVEQIVSGVAHFKRDMDVTKQRCVLLINLSSEDYRDLISTLLLEQYALASNQVQS
jgi:hypothetical protein